MNNAIPNNSGQSRSIQPGDARQPVITMLSDVDGDKNNRYLV